VSRIGETRERRVRVFRSAIRFSAKVSSRRVMAEIITSAGFEADNALAAHTFSLYEVWYRFGTAKEPPARG